MQNVAIPSGFTHVDAALGGGWPQPSLIELYTDVYGIGELQLILPLISHVIEASVSPLLLWLNPPHWPNAVALSQQGLHTAQHWVCMDMSAVDTLWSIEQGLRSDACSVVIAWVSAPAAASLRRVKLAATNSHAVAILYRPTNESCQSSPATVRARLTPCDTQLKIEFLKIQGRASCDVAIDVESGQLCARS